MEIIQLMPKIFKDYYIYTYIMDSDFIWTKPNLISRELCQNIINKFESMSQYHVDGQLGSQQTSPDNLNLHPGSGGYVAKQWKDSREMCINHYPEWSICVEKLSHFVREAIKEYIEEADKTILKHIEDPRDVYFARHFALGTYQDFSNFNIQRILKGRRYRWHHDFMPADPNRILTFMIYLNDMKEGEGGHTMFVSGKKVRPEAGKFIAFPSTWTTLHSGELIGADAKYLIVGGINRIPTDYPNMDEHY